MSIGNVFNQYYYNKITDTKINLTPQDDLDVAKQPLLGQLSEQMSYAFSLG